jgi:hypothetical protein
MQEQAAQFHALHNNCGQVLVILRLSFAVFRMIGLFLRVKAAGCRSMDDVETLCVGDPVYGGSNFRISPRDET